MVSESFPIIILEVGSTPGQEIELRKSEYLIGRESGLDLTISSPAISRRHARLLRKGVQVQLEDLGSSNGTFVNGIRLSAIANLKPGDEITLGQTIRLRYLGLPGELKTQQLEASLKDKTELEGATRLESPPPLQEPAPEPKLTRRFPPSVDQAPPPVEVRPEKKQPDKAPPAPLPRPPTFPPAAVAVPASPIPASGQPPALSETVLGDDSLKREEQPPRLVVTIAGGQPQAYLLQGERITLGRGEDNDIPIPFKIISGHHAVIEKSNGVYHFRVLPDVTNPVFFQGKPVQSVIALRHGDLLRIGSMDPGLMVTLEYQTQSASISAPAIRFDQNNRVQIGRDPQNDVVLDTPTVSRYHAIVERVGQRYRVRDLGSSNGTFVNDQRIEAETWLKAGDWIRIGPYRFDLGQDQLAQVLEAGGMRVEILGLNKWVRPDLNLLKDISLLFQPREFIVVVGQSGGGKSTLLDAVAGFRPATHGQVLINDIDIYKNFDAIRNEIGFVPQKDIIHMELTVYQGLDYAAQLRMPADTSAEERHQRVMEVLKDLDLVHRKDVQISGLSGGQQKRVSIGVELLTKPGLFFLDEPTSGLDPGTETSLMHLMRRLADQGRTIVLITHATKNVMLADKVVFLARGGYIAWFGPPNEALQYFDQFRSERDRKARSMEFDEIYAILDDPSKGKPEEWAERYRRNPAYPEHIVQPLQALGRSLPGLAAGKPAERELAKRPAHKPQRNQVSGLRQFAILSARNIKILTRDRASLVLMMISAPLVALLDVLMAVILGRDLFSFQDGDMANVVTALFQPVIFAVMIGALSQMREFVKESEIYRRERLVNLKVLPYVMSKIWVAALLALYQAAAFSIVHYLAFKMPGGATEFALFYFTLVLAALSGMMLGLFASAIAPNANTAPLLVIMLIIPQVVVGGALIPMPSSVSAVTTTRWSFEGLIIITGAGSAVAADACWDLPEDVRESMTLDDKLAQGCRCLGINALRQETCNFAGLGEYYDPALDEAEPVEPADIGDPPAEPVIPPAPAEPADPNDRIAVAQYLQALQDYQDQVQKIRDEYKAQLEDYQARADVYKAEMTDYQEKRTEWEVNRNAAVGKAERTISLFKDNFGWAFVDKEDTATYWSRLVFTWMMQGLMITVLFLFILFAIYRKDRAK